MGASSRRTVFSSQIIITIYSICYVIFRGIAILIYLYEKQMSEKPLHILMGCCTRYTYMNPSNGWMLANLCIYFVLAQIIRSIEVYSFETFTFANDFPSAGAAITRHWFNGHFRANMHRHAACGTVSLLNLSHEKHHHDVAEHSFVQWEPVFGIRRADVCRDWNALNEWNVMVSGVHVTDVRQAATRHRENVLIKNWNGETDSKLI